MSTNPEVKEIASADKCPVCGSTERDLGNFVKELKSQDKLGVVFQGGLTLQTQPFVDPRKNIVIGTKAPVSFMTIDACAKCGTLYRVSTKIMNVTVTDIRAGGAGNGH